MRVRLIVAALVGVGLALVVVQAAHHDTSDGGNSVKPDTASAGKTDQKTSESKTGSTRKAEQGSEVISHPAGSAVTGLPGLRRGTRPTTQALVTAPLPKTASRVGGVVPGFPVAVVPVIAGGTVSSSGVSTTAVTMQVSVVAKSSKSPVAVLAFYRRALSAQGFVEQGVPAVGGSTAANFTRQNDHIVVTVSRPGRTTNYSVFGTLHARARG